MPLPGYEETLKRFGLENLKPRIDLVIVNGDIARTPDGDFQMGNSQTNALFRFVEGWRRTEPTVNDLFASMLRSQSQLEEARNRDKGPSLRADPQAYHAVADSILEYQSVSSILAGSIFIVLNNLLQRLRDDLNGYVSQEDWKAGPKINGYSIGEIFYAAAANFRHHHVPRLLPANNAAQWKCFAMYAIYPY